MFYMYNRYSEEDKCSPAIDDSKIIDFDTLQSTREELARETWYSIRNEELVHIGELLGLLEYLAPYQKYYINKGMEEFNMMKK